MIDGFALSNHLPEILRRVEKGEHLAEIRESDYRDYDRFLAAIKSALADGFVVVCWQQGDNYILIDCRSHDKTTPP